jgi:hypothetical protein
VHCCDADANGVVDYLVGGCTAGARTQDEAAEDPLTAAQLGVSPNYELYFTNKLQVNF